LQRLKDKGFLQGRAVQRTDSLAIVACVRQLSRLELVRETLRPALEALAKQDRAWLQAHTPSHWRHTYGSWTQGERLVRETGPRAAAETRRLLLRTGQDGFALLDVLETPEGEALRPLPAVVVLRTVWSQQYQREQPQTSVTPRETTETQTLCPDHPKELPQKAAVQMLPASAVEQGQRGNIVVTPHDPPARRATKGAQAWNGYKLPLSETATEDAPLLIMDLQVGAAAAYDCPALAAIQQRLQARDLLPNPQLADGSYVNGPTLHRSRERQVELLGPVPAATFGASRQERLYCRRSFRSGCREPTGYLPGWSPEPALVDMGED
jgi:hypothetical protein